MSDPQIVDDSQVPADNSTDPDKPTLDSVVKPVPDKAPDTSADPTPAVAPAVPDKYKDKSIAQVIEMHQNAESLLGRQSSEVGELRNVVDEFIQSQSTNTTTEPTVDEPDFLDDPDAAMSRAIENHPTVKKAVQDAATNDQQARLAGLKAKYPDLDKTFADPKFLEWIQSSDYRTRALREANQKYDTIAADEIFSEWDRVKPAEVVDDPAATTTQDAIDQAAANANTGVIKGGAGGGQKVYRRADLIKLKVEDPDRHAALEDEIYLAYKEGRVI